MQSAKNPIKIRYKLRKLEQFENRNSDFIGRHFEYLTNFLKIFKANIIPNFKAPQFQSKLYRFFKNQLFLKEESIKNA